MNRRGILKTIGALGAAAILPSAARAQNQSAIAGVRQRGVLRVGLSTFVPWAMRSRTGDLIGFEIDVGRRLAQDLNVRYEPNPTAWDGIIPAMLSGRFDVIISGMSITPQRLESVDFTEPYATSGQSMVANRRLAPNWNTLAQFNQPTVTLALRRGTSTIAAVQEHMPLAVVRQFDDDAQCEQEVLNGRAHAWVTTIPKPAFAALAAPDRLYLPLSEPFVRSREAMAVRKGDAETVAALNQWIAARTADGFLATRNRYWFATREWADQVAQS